MKVKCPWCKDDVDLASDCSCVKCEQCDVEWDFGEYIQVAAKEDPASSELLADYDENTEGESEELVEWN